MAGVLRETLAVALALCMMGAFIGVHRNGPGNLHQVHIDNPILSATLPLCHERWCSHEKQFPKYPSIG